jgi:hypothetical protein
LGRGRRIVLVAVTDSTGGARDDVSILSCGSRHGGTSVEERASLARAAGQVRLGHHARPRFFLGGARPRFVDAKHAEFVFQPNTMKNRMISSYLSSFLLVHPIKRTLNQTHAKLLTRDDKRTCKLDTCRHEANIEGENHG